MLNLENNSLTHHADNYRRQIIDRFRQNFDELISSDAIGMERSLLARFRLSEDEQVNLLGRISSLENYNNFCDEFGNYNLNGMVALMQDNSTFIENEMLICLSSILQRRIIIYTRDSNSRYLLNIIRPHNLIQNSQPLRILLNGQHYNALVPSIKFGNINLI